MTGIDRGTLFRRAFERAGADSFFLASALVDYQRAYDLDDHALAARLGCSADGLPRLGLCRRPDPQSSSFGPDVRQIASYAGVQPLRLAQLLREVDASAALEHGGESLTRLLAARDATADDEDR